MKKSGIYLLLLIAISLAACSPSEPPATTAALKPAFEEVTFTTEDDRELVGRLYGDGDVAVVLAHMLGGGQSKLNWVFFAEELASRGYTALVFDFRGMGQSEGPQETNLTRIDARTAIEFLQGRGFEKIVCIGASMGGTACLSAAFDVEISGVIGLSSAESMGAPTELTEADLAALTIPKLFIIAENDQPSSEANQRMYEYAAQPKEIKIFEGNSHGSNMFKTAYREELEQLIFDFLEGL